MKTVYLLLFVLLALASCKKHRNTPDPKYYPPIDSITGAWFATDDYTDFIIINKDLQVKFPNTIPASLEGTQPVTIQYQADTISAKDTLYLIPANANYPKLKFYLYFNTHSIKSLQFTAKDMVRQY